MIYAPKLNAYVVLSSGTQRFPISSVGITKYNTIRSYYMVSAPLNIDLYTQISIENIATMYLEKDGGAWEQFNIDTPRYYMGPNSQSMTFAGSRQQTNASPTTVTLNSSQYQDIGTDSEGRTIVEMVPWAVEIKPGDSVYIDSVLYPVFAVTTQAGSQSTTQTLTLGT